MLVAAAGSNDLDRVKAVVGSNVFVQMESLKLTQRTT